MYRCCRFEHLSFELAFINPLRSAAAKFREAATSTVSWKFARRRHHALKNGGEFATLDGQR